MTVNDLANVIAALAQRWRETSVIPPAIRLGGGIDHDTRTILERGAALATAADEAACRAVGVPAPCTISTVASLLMARGDVEGRS